MGHLLHFPEHPPGPYESPHPGDDPRGGGVTLVCLVCAWTGHQADACDHHRQTGHAIRIRNCPTSWPNCTFTESP
jgi:hypothetical protein